MSSCDVAPESASEDVASARDTRAERTAGLLFAQALTVTMPALIAFGAIESGGTANRIPANAIRQWRAGIALFAYLSPFWLLFALGLAALWVLQASVRDAARTRGLPALAPELVPDVIAASLPAAAIFVLAVDRVTFVSATTFHNHVLGSLLVALVSLVALVLSAISWLAAFAGVRKLRAKARRPGLARSLVWSLAALPLAAVAWWVVRANYGAFRVLGPWLFAGPGAALIVVVALALFRAWRVARKRWLRLTMLAAFPLSVAAAISVGYGSPSLPLVAVESGHWSKHLVFVARALTDLDGDGSSSWFGGGDCAPFDSAIHPRARDVPGDGIDNNCFNGDAPLPTNDRGPTWDENYRSVGSPRNLIVVTIEAVRGDHISALGYPRKTTPRIDELAHRSALFSRMYAASSATGLSLPAIWTTRTPTRMPVEKGRVVSTIPWVPEVLQADGFSSGAFLVSWGAFYKTSQFSRGFGNYDNSTPLTLKGDDFKGFPSKDVVDKAIRFIEQNASGRFFVWMHLVEPHAAYERAPGAPNFGDSELDRYDSELWTADHELGRLVDFLEAARLMKRTMIVITGDHAEGLGDHGVRTHFNTVFDSEVRTLGLLYVPRMSERVIEQPVVHADLMVTAMNLLGVRRDFDRLRGRNLIPALRGFSVEPDDVFVELAGQGMNPAYVALVRWPFKLIHTLGTSSYRLYNLERDPKESTDLAGEQTPQLAEMRERVQLHVEGILER